MALYFNLLGATNTWTAANTFAPTVANTNPVAIAAGTMTADTKVLNITGTWNNAAVTFSAPIFINITDTNSGASSLLIDIQRGGSSVFALTKFGNITALNSINAVNSITSGSDTFTLRAGVGVDVSFGRKAAATWRFGAADAATAIAQTLTVSSIVAGTSNVSGANWTIIGSQSTGSGTSGDIIFQTGGTGAGATVQNTATTALTIKGATQAVTIASGKSLVLGNAATTGLTAGVLAAITNASIVITDSTGQAYRVPCII